MLINFNDEFATKFCSVMILKDQQYVIIITS